MKLGTARKIRQDFPQLPDNQALREWIRRVIIYKLQTFDRELKFCGPKKMKIICNSKNKGKRKVQLF